MLMRKFDRTHSGSFTACKNRLIEYINLLKGRVNFDDFIQLCVVLQTLTASFRAKDTDRDGYINIRKFFLF